MKPNDKVLVNEIKPKLDSGSVGERRVSGGHRADMKDINVSFGDGGVQKKGEYMTDAK